MTSATAMLAVPRGITLLGPQRLTPTLADAVAAAGIDVHAPDGLPLAAITAGWQEREDDDRALAEHVSERVVNLRLYARAEEIFASDQELAEAHRQRGRRLQEIQAHYELRLGFAMDAIYELIARTGLDHPEVVDSFDYVRALDARLLANNADVIAGYEDRWRPGEREAVARHRADIARVMSGCCALAIAGGNVPILLNRMRLLAVAEHVAGLPVFAWSAGAMVATERIVVFHDDPPHGHSHARMFETGLGWARDIVAFPHAHRRLHLDDTTRMAVLERRFAPARCALMADGSIIDGGAPTA